MDDKVNRKINFDQMVLQRSMVVPVLMEISMNYCGPCLWMEKILIDLVSSFETHLDFVSINLSDHPELKTALNLRRNPTVLLFINGKEKARFTGALPAYAVDQWLHDHIMDTDV